VEQIQIRPLTGIERQVLRVRQTGHRVLGREAGNVEGGTHRVLQGLGREIRGAGIAAALPQIDRDAERLVAIALHVLQLPHAGGDRKAAAFRDLGTGIAGAQAFGFRKHVFNQLLELVDPVCEAAAGAQGGLGRGGGGRCRLGHGWHQNKRWSPALASPCS